MPESRLLWIALLAMIGCGAREPQPSAAPVTAPPTVAAPDAWPFVAWDRAEAFTFNHVDYGPGIPLRIFDAESGWSPKIVDRKPIDGVLAERAVELTGATRGEMEVSKCPFPRHGIVLYAGDTPVGSVSVCFSCGDIMVWPDFEASQKLEFDDETEAIYEATFTSWQGLFRDELGWSIDYAGTP